MLALPIWLTKTHLTLSALELLVFLLATLFVVVIVSIISYRIGRGRRESPSPQTHLTATEEKVEEIVKGPPDHPAPSPAKPAVQPPIALAATSTVKPQTLRRPVTAAPRPLAGTSVPVGKVGLRTEALVKLPKIARRRRARGAAILITGTIVAAAIAGGYFLLTKTELLRKKPPAEPAPFVEVTPTVTPPPAGGPTATPEPTPTPEPQETVTIQTTETGFLNVREGSGLNTPIITTVNPGKEYELLDESENGDWYKIQVDEDTAGWVASRYVTKNEPATPVDE